MKRRFIQQDFIQRLREQADIVDVVGRTLNLKKTGSSYQALCPFHDEKTPSFNLNPQGNYFHCFGCGASGDVFKFLMKRESVDFAGAVHRLAEQMGLKVVYEDDGSSYDSRLAEQNFAVLKQAQGFYRRQLQSAAGERARLYFTERGISEKVIEDYALGYAPLKGNRLLQSLEGTQDKEAAIRVGLIRPRERDGETMDAYDFFRGRVIFPIVDQRGRTLGFGGRLIGEGEPKYINSVDGPAFHKGREFYGVPQALQTKQASLVVVEGYMDVLALAGTASALASLGTAFTEHHAQKLLRWTDDLHFAFDGDEAGRQAAQRAMRQCLPLLRDDKRISFVFLPAGEDPHSIMQSQGADGWNQLTRIPFNQFVLRELEDTQTMEEMARRVERIAEILAYLPAGNLRQLLRKKAEDMTGISITIPPITTRERTVVLSGMRMKRGTATEDRASQPPQPMKQSITPVMQRFLAQLLAKPELCAELDEEWRELLWRRKEERGDLGLMARAMVAAARGAGYFYGYIHGCGRHIGSEANADGPSLYSLKQCVYRILEHKTKEEIKLAIRREDRAKVDRAKETLAKLSELWRAAKRRHRADMGARHVFSE